MIGRIAEKARLLKYAESDESEFVAVYGRRRVGKTYLVRETLGPDFAFSHVGMASGSMEAQLLHLEGFLAGVKKKLSNECFVANAPEAVVALERKKQSDSEEKITSLKESIAALKNK